MKPELLALLPQAPAADALVRGEISILPSLYNIVFTKQRDGAPVELFFAPEGMPINPYAAGITASAKNPNVTPQRQTS